MERMARKKSGREQFFGGLGALAIMGLIWFAISGGEFKNPFEGHWWVIFPVLFIGVFPLLSGLRRMLGQSRADKENEARVISQHSDNAERIALKVARNNRGIATPALMALEGNISMEEADKTLQRLAGRGYAEMNVRDNGVIEYAFPELREESKKRI